MVPKIIPEWYFCEQCEDWIGSKPPFLPHLWGNDRSAAMHKRQTKHTVTKVTHRELLPPKNAYPEDSSGANDPNLVLHPDGYPVDEMGG